MNKNNYICQLSTYELNLIKNNLHCIQYFCDIDRIKLNSENNVKPFYKYSRLTNTNSKKTNLCNNINNFKKKKLVETFNDIIEVKSYIRRGQRPITVLHLGQLKLFLATFQFLLKYSVNIKTVYIVYAGAAPGYNIHLLTKFFPNCKWILYDPNNFYDSLRINPNIIKINNDLFCDNDCIKLNNIYKNKYLLFISDIRIDSDEKSILRDNDLQKKWVELLKPNYAQLKFRLSRLCNNYNYFDGIIYFQSYAPATSTESRLVINGKKLEYKNYNYENYDNIMYTFNRELRPAYYKNNYKIKYLDHCHDCCFFIKLIEDYKYDYNNLLKQYKINYKLNNKIAVLPVEKIILYIYKNIQNLNLRLKKFNDGIIQNLYY